MGGTQTMFPMLDQEGNPGFVPQDRVHEAILNGGQVGFHVVGPDGTEGVIPAAHLADAIKGGGRLKQAAQEKTQFEAERDPANQTGGVMSTVKEAGRIGMGLLTAPGAAAENPAATAIQRGAQFAVDDSRRQAEGRSGAYRAAAAVGDLTGVANSDEMERQANVGNARGVVGTAVADAGAAAVAPKAAEKMRGSVARESGPLAAYKVTDAPAAAEKLTNAINPNPEEMPQFRRNMEAHVARIKQYADSHGIKIVDRNSLRQAMEGAARDHQEVYDKQLLEPVQNEVASNGKTFGENERRLRHLNSTTNYAPTTAAETEAQLARKAEASHLREVQNEGIARRMGVTPEQVAEARSAGEQLRDMAHKTEYSMDLEQHAQNASERGNAANLHATPHGAYVTTGGRIGAKLNRGVNALFGHPGDNAVRDVFAGLQVDKPNTPVPNVPEAEAARKNRTAAENSRLTDQQRRAIAGAAVDKNKPAPRPGTATIGEILDAKDSESRQRQMQSDRQQRTQARGAASQEAQKQQERIQQERAQRLAKHGAMMRDAAQRGLKTE